MVFRLYDFKCDACDYIQEKLVEKGEEVFCPNCKGEMHRIPNTFGLCIPEYLGRCKINKAPDINLKDGNSEGRKQWENS